MLLTRFTVVGYKNLTAPISLENLAPINVVHGPNNVGKSNLLEAMALFFRCLTPIEPATDGSTPGGLPIKVPRRLGAEEIDTFVSHPRELFNLDKTGPIRLTGAIQIDKNELIAAGVAELYPSTSLEIDVTLEWDNDAAVASITRFQFAGGVDVTKKAESAEEKQRQLRFARFLAKNVLVRSGPDQRFAVINVRRDLEFDDIPRGDEHVPLALEMHDCRDSPDTARRNRWRAFVQAMQAFQDTTGKGEFEVTYQRTENRARLMFDTEATRMPFALLGSGVQQLAAVLGHILVRNASIVAIEEPELNLRYDLQDKLREALKAIVDDPKSGITQLFLTSHSPAFETANEFFFMDRGPEGPVVTKKDASALAHVIGSSASHLGLPEKAPTGYVTSQGVLRLHEHALERLAIKPGVGGGIVVLDAEPKGIRVVSNEQYLDELGLAEPKAGHDD